MIKTLTEQWIERTLTEGYYYIRWSFDIDDEPSYMIDFYDRENFVGGAFINKQHKFIDEVMCAVPIYDEYEQLVSNSDELLQKIHILNEQNIKQYNELCEEIKKNNILEKRLAIATKSLERYSKDDYYSEAGGRSVNPYPHIARKALKEMEGVK